LPALLPTGPCLLASRLGFPGLSSSLRPVAKPLVELRPQYLLARRAKPYDLVWLAGLRSKPYYPLTDCLSSRPNTRLPSIPGVAARLTWFGRPLDRVKPADFPACAFPSACGSSGLAPQFPACRMSPRACLIHGAPRLRAGPLACWPPQPGGPGLSASSRWVFDPPPIRFSLSQAPERDLVHATYPLVVYQRPLPD
jgi:hypothetical protein